MRERNIFGRLLWMYVGGLYNKQKAKISRAGGQAMSEAEFQLAVEGYEG